MTMLNHSKKIQRTKIWPLRWIGNICSEIATTHLVKAINLEEELDDNLSFCYKYHAKMWVMFNKPYKRWGTVYTIDIKAWKKELDEIKLEISGDGWDDYDEFGKAYWDKDE
jgi:hypothetical protein